MWTRIGNPLEEFPEWVQPIGAHDAYEAGSKVSHNGKKWVSTAPANVWEPDVYGWEDTPSPWRKWHRKPPGSHRTAPRRSRGSNYPIAAQKAREGRQKPLLLGP